MSTFVIIFCISVILTSTNKMCNSMKVRYVITEHPKITFVNHAYMNYFNLTSKRSGRGDPFYYVTLRFSSVYEFDNNITGHFYFYEFLSNSYRRSFVELHFGLCDLIDKDLLFGPPLKQGRLKQSCPYPAGAYELLNMTVPLRTVNVMKHFPFLKGRVYANLTATATKELIISGHIDIEIKQGHVNKTNWVDKTTN